MGEADPGKRQAIIPSPVGALRLRAEGGALVAIDFVESGTETPTPPEDPLLRAAAAELADYFENPAHTFRLPLRPEGTEYLRRIWDALRAIPPGATETYGSLAVQAGGSARSIGLACRKNPLPIVIPCHRVVGRAGLTGYAGHRSGSGLAVKRWLLQHEGCRID